VVAALEEATDRRPREQQPERHSDPEHDQNPQGQLDQERGGPPAGVAAVEACRDGDSSAQQRAPPSQREQYRPGDRERERLQQQREARPDGNVRHLLTRRGGHLVATL
jgi:hypothetical protein